MNDKPDDKSTNAPKPEASHGPCLCQAVGPLLTEFLRRIGPPEEARQHFDSARIEFLKGLRSLLDAKIERVARRSAKGEKIPVE